jgi:hypothetical protein
MKGTTMNYLIWLALCLLLGGSVVSVSAQEAEKARKTIPIAELQAALGKDHLSQEIYDLREVLGLETAATYFDPMVLGGGFWHSWPSKGVDMSFDREGKLEYVVLHSGRKLRPDNKAAKYTGELPEKLSFDDTMASVRRKLGQPEKTYEGFLGSEKDSRPPVCANYEYPSKGIIVGFDPRGFKDDIALIVCVIMYKPGK